MKHKSFIFLFPLLAALVSCGQKENGTSLPRDEVQTVRFMLTQYEGDAVDSKTSYDLDNMQFLWAEGDIVGIISSEGNQLKFPIKPDFYGQSYADFDGRGFALISGESLGGFDKNGAVLYSIGRSHPYNICRNGGIGRRARFRSV